MKLSQTPKSLQDEMAIILTGLTDMGEAQIAELPVRHEVLKLEDIDWFSLPLSKSANGSCDCLTMYGGTVWSGLSALYESKENDREFIDVYHVDEVLPDFFEPTEVKVKSREKDYGIEKLFFDMESFKIRGETLYDRYNEPIGKLKVSSMPKVSNGIVVDQIEITSRHQNKGLGTQVMNEILRQARKSNLIVGLTTESMLGSQHQARLRKWYESLGFSPSPSRSKMGTEYFKLPRTPSNEIELGLTA